MHLVSLGQLLLQALVHLQQAHQCCRCRTSPALLFIGRQTAPTHAPGCGEMLWGAQAATPSSPPQERMWQGQGTPAWKQRTERPES